MSNQAVHAVMTEDAYKAVMGLIADLTCEESMQWVFEEYPELSGFYSGYGVHPVDCCGAFDRLLAQDGYIKNKGGVSV